MPLYSYICPCGNKLDIRCSVDERDKQFCGGHRPSCPRAEVAGEFSAPLQREEIPEPGGAPAAYNWSKWQR